MGGLSTYKKCVGGKVTDRDVEVAKKISSWTFSLRARHSLIGSVA